MPELRLSGTGALVFLVTLPDELGTAYRAPCPPNSAAEMPSLC